MACCRIALLALSLLAAPAVSAQSPAPAADPEKQVHWAVGAFFGTGWYQVDQNRSVFVMRIPPRQTLRESSIDDQGRRTIGIEIHYPLSLGLSRLEEIPDFIEFDNYATVSFTPGVQLEIPVDPRWTLRPYLHLGYGWESETGEGATIWYGGVKSRYRLRDGRTRWDLLNGVFHAGYRPEYQSRGQYGAVMAGLEFSHPLASRPGGVEGLDLNWHLTYNWFFDELNFHVDRDRLESFRDQWEVGLSVARRDRTLSLGFLDFEQIGLAYRFSSNGRFDAITVNFRSPFEE